MREILMTTWWWIIIWTKISFSGGWHCLGNLKFPWLIWWFLSPNSVSSLILGLLGGFLWPWLLFFPDCFLNVMIFILSNIQILVQENFKLLDNFSACVLQPRFATWRLRDEELTNPGTPFCHILWLDGCFFFWKKISKNPLWTWPPHRVVS